MTMAATITVPFDVALARLRTLQREIARRPPLTISPAQPPAWLRTEHAARAVPTSPRRRSAALDLKPFPAPAPRSDAKETASAPQKPPGRAVQPTSKPKKPKRVQQTP